MDVKSSTGSERTAPRRGYFFFFAATLRLAGAFFFAAVFAFVAFFTILPSWPKPSGGVASAPTRIVGTASRLLQPNKKNIFHINETCTKRPRSRHSRDTSRFIQAQSSARARHPRNHANRICKITKMPGKWALLRCTDHDLRPREQPLDRLRGDACIAQNRRLEIAIEP